MGCGSCGTKNGLPKGCNNNGACGVDGCGKLTVFDWLANMRLPKGQEQFDFVEVRFKNDRKLYYKNENNIAINIGDVVAVEGNPGHDIGIVTLTGELVRIQMKKKHQSYKGEDVKKVYRKANQKDIETWREYRERETQTMIDSRIIAKRLGLEMKICDVEYQGDGGKVTFYYTADGRVDFRQLIKEYASKFGVRIEMKQIGYRQEAAKVGGIGSCGRELCCSTWLTDFRTVSTAAARYQQLSINSQKLAGQCGKLKCCLNYELDSYLDALNNFPTMDTKLNTEKGYANCVKIDVFKREMWFSYDQGGVMWYKFSVEDVQEFMAINAKDQKLESLEDLAKNSIIEKKIDFIDVIGEDSLERFERKNRPSNRKRSNQRNKNRGNQPATQKNNQGEKNAKTANQPNANASRNANQQNRKRPNQQRAKQGGAPQTKNQRNRPKPEQGGSNVKGNQNSTGEQKKSVPKKRFHRGNQNRKKD
ncbi:regulatory iron-sulfur-containing complex subunit RicT [Vaginella massiliensis]|uniref:PSP1 domain-containing protein n=1 Tax=Vaginella massiliensis TaxID=1816680 RepID=UPI003750372D